MNYKLNNLEVIVYNENLVSIKDTLEDIDISKSKWDFVFDFLLDRTSDFYFLGEKLEYLDSQMKDSLSILSERTIFIDEDYQQVYFKLKAANLIVSRNLLFRLWSYYELPAIIFLVEKKDEKSLSQLVAKQVTYTEFAVSIPGLYIVHRNFEPNVLWIANGVGVQSMIFNDIG